MSEILLTFNSGNNALRFVSLLLVFVFVLAITYFTTRFIAGYQKGKIAGSNIQIIETARITQDKYIQIVKIGKKYVAIAISKNEITKIADLSEDDITIPKDSDNKEFGFKSFLENAVGAHTQKKENDSLEQFISDNQNSYSDDNN